MWPLNCNLTFLFLFLFSFVLALSGCKPENRRTLNVSAAIPSSSSNTQLNENDNSSDHELPFVAAAAAPKLDTPETSQEAYDQQALARDHHQTEQYWDEIVKLKQERIRDEARKVKELEKQNKIKIATTKKTTESVSSEPSINANKNEDQAIQIKVAKEQRLQKANDYQETRKRAEEYQKKLKEIEEEKKLEREKLEKARIEWWKAKQKADQQNAEKKARAENKAKNDKKSVEDEAEKTDKSEKNEIVKETIIKEVVKERTAEEIATEKEKNFAEFQAKQEEIANEAHLLQVEQDKQIQEEMKNKVNFDKNDWTYFTEHNSNFCESYMTDQWEEFGSKKDEPTFHDLEGAYKIIPLPSFSKFELIKNTSTEINNNFIETTMKSKKDAIFVGNGPLFNDDGSYRGLVINQSDDRPVNINNVNCLSALFDNIIPPSDNKNYHLNNGVFVKYHLKEEYQLEDGAVPQKIITEHYAIIPTLDYCNFVMPADYKNHLKENSNTDEDIKNLKKNELNENLKSVDQIEFAVQSGQMVELGDEEDEENFLLRINSDKISTKIFLGIMSDLGPAIILVNSNIGLNCLSKVLMTSGIMSFLHLDSNIVDGIYRKDRDSLLYGFERPEEFETSDLKAASALVITVTNPLVED